MIKANSSKEGDAKPSGLNPVEALLKREMLAGLPFLDFDAFAFLCIGRPPENLQEAESNENIQHRIGKGCRERKEG